MVSRQRTQLLGKAQRTFAGIPFRFLSRLVEGIDEAKEGLAEAKPCLKNPHTNGSTLNHWHGCVVPMLKFMAQWPAVEHEERAWRNVQQAQLPQGNLVAEQYSAAVLPRISDRPVRVDGGVQSLADEASSDLARFDAELGQTFRSFGSVLLLAESVSSSGIENLTSSARDIALTEIGRRTPPNARSILANLNANLLALSWASSVDCQAALAIHRALLEQSDPASAGGWRDQQVWIGGGYGPATALFVPPHHDRVSSYMEDLSIFNRRTDLPLLLQSAIAHAQFETIHPFSDGNGRVGRALFQGMLRGGLLTRNVVVPISAGLIQDTARYSAALDAYRQGDIDPIIRTFAEASFRAVDNARSLIKDLELIQMSEAPWV